MKERLGVPALAGMLGVLILPPEGGAPNLALPPSDS